MVAFSDHDDHGAYKLLSAYPTPAQGHLSCFVFVVFILR